MKNILFLFAAFVLASQTFAQTQIKDADNNTKVQTEAFPNEDRVRISTGGTERLIIRKNANSFCQIDFPNNGENLFLGTSAGGLNNASGTKNVFIGFNAGAANVSGGSNTYVGHKAGAVSTGNQNSFFGSSAGLANTTGFANCFFGSDAGRNNNTGVHNTFMGVSSGILTTSGTENAFVGVQAGNANTTGSRNTALGSNAGNNGGNHTNCTFLGQNAAASGNNLTNATALGSGASVNASNKIRFGNTAVTVIEGQVAYTVSDGRFKSDVKADAPGLDFVMGLRPVTYHFDYNDFSRFLGETSVDYSVLAEKEQKRELGFVAQEVETLCQEQGLDLSNIIHVPENEADNYSVAYGQIVVPLVKAVQEQQAQIEELKSLVALLTAQNKTVAASSLQVWPNPTGDVLNVSLSGVSEGVAISIFSADGKLLRNQPAREGVQQFDLKHLPAGNYLLQANVQGQTLVSKAVAKTN